MDFTCNFFGGQQRKALRQIEAHLMAEQRQRAGAGSVLLAPALAQQQIEEIEILSHRSI